MTPDPILFLLWLALVVFLAAILYVSMSDDQDQ